MSVSLTNILIVVGIIVGISGTLITSSLNMSEVLVAAEEDERSDTLKALKNTKKVVEKCSFSDSTKNKINDSLDTALQLLTVNGEVQSAKEIHDTISEKFFPCDIRKP